MNEHNLSIDELTRLAYELARKKGWWDLEPYPRNNIPEKLALIHSEISEALEEYRRAPSEIFNYRFSQPGGTKPLGFGIELADAIIRIADLAGYLQIDLETCIRIKMEYNKTREYRHGGKAC